MSLKYLTLLQKIPRRQLLKINLNKRYLATASTLSKLENIYDVVIVGGGISGSALACALASSKITKSQKHIALIELNNISNIKEWKPKQGEFSNRVSSLTPRSVQFFKGIYHEFNFFHQKKKNHQK